jgi:hypothetical protein
MAYRAAAYGHSNAGLDERSFPRSAACVAGHDAPRIGERAAARGATEGGDEHAGMTAIALATVRNHHARGERRDQGRAR